jgi:uncharacterized pyridoxamine 5'-phosphate oxidase family protein
MIKFNLIHFNLKITQLINKKFYFVAKRQRNPFFMIIKNPNIRLDGFIID